MHAGLVDRVGQIGVRHHAGALPEAQQHDACPLEVADPVAVEVQHDLRPLGERAVDPPGGGAVRVRGQRCVGAAVDAQEAVVVGQLQQPVQRGVAARRTGADEQNVDRAVFQPVLLHPVVGLAGEGVAAGELDIGDVRLRRGEGGGRQVAGHEVHHVAADVAQDFRRLEVDVEQ